MSVRPKIKALALSNLHLGESEGLLYNSNDEFTPGGRLLKEDRKIRLKGKFITLWNTGGWIVPSEVFSPDAYIFYITQSEIGTKPK